MFTRKTNLRYCILFVVISIMAISMIGCGGASKNETAAGNDTSAKSTANDVSKSKVVVFVDDNWDSVRIHNEIAKFIVEKGYGYKTDIASTTTLDRAGGGIYKAISSGQVDVYMECWSKGDVYDKGIADGTILKLSKNFTGKEGLYVPAYVINGDEAKGIKPVAPDLKKVSDLLKYADKFKDPKDPTKGVIYGAVENWSADAKLKNTMKELGLDKKFNYKSPATDAALDKTIVPYLEKGEPIVTYYWEPTKTAGKYSLIKLEEDSQITQKLPDTEVIIAANGELKKTAPDVVEFLKKYSPGVELSNKMLLLKSDKNLSLTDTAKEFLKTNEEWTKWVTPEAAKNVKNALK